eukprot:766832-Hanusia_phi.AAC.3
MFRFQSRRNVDLKNQDNNIALSTTTLLLPHIKILYRAGRLEREREMRRNRMEERMEERRRRMEERRRRMRMEERRRRMEEEDGGG